MKLSRTKVIGKLEARAARCVEKADRLEAGVDAENEAKKAALVKACERFVARQTDATLKALTQAEYNYKRSYNNKQYEARNLRNHAALVRQEVSLLKLSDDENISVRTNSDLARWLVN